MPDPAQGNDEERLPWLEPYRATVARPVPAKPGRRGAGIVIGGVAALAAALTAGYYIGQLDPRPTQPSAEIAVAPQTPAPVAPPAATAPQPGAEAAPPVEAAPEPAVPKLAAATATAKKTVRQKIRQKSKIRSASIASAKAKRVRATQQPRAAPGRAVYRAWPKMPSPGPAGQVIQLGAFRNPSGANRAYRTRLARYPVLGRMPRVVVPVITKPRGQILYVLRLGTTSRQQSRIVCRNLRASGDHCLVIG